MEQNSTDNNGEVSDFKNVILIMTSNLGTKEPNIMGFNKDISISNNRAIKEFFSSEFRNRLSSIVEFNELSLSDLESIVKLELKSIKSILINKDIKLSISPKAIKEIAKRAYMKFGAREIKRILETEIKQKLSKEILFGKLKDGGIAKVGYKNSKFTFGFE